METVDVLNEFVEKVHKLAFKMQDEADKPGMPDYLKTVSNELSKLCIYYKNLGWEVDHTTINKCY